MVELVAAACQAVNSCLNDFILTSIFWVLPNLDKPESEKKEHRGHREDTEICKFFSVNLCAPSVNLCATSFLLTVQEVDS